MSETSCVSGRSAVSHLLRPHDAVGLGLQPRDLETFALELLERIQHRLVLGLALKRCVGRDRHGTARHRRSRGCRTPSRRKSRRCTRAARRSRPRPAPAPSRPTRARAARTRGPPTMDCRARRRAQTLDHRARRRADRPAWSPRNRDRSGSVDVHCCADRSIRRWLKAGQPLLPGRPAPRLHRSEDAAQDVHFVLIELRAIEQAAECAPSDVRRRCDRENRCPPAPARYARTSAPSRPHRERHFVRLRLAARPGASRATTRTRTPARPSRD